MAHFQFCLFFVFLVDLVSSQSNSQKICGTVIISSSKISLRQILQNHSTCLVLVPVNYQICLQLLERSLYCNALVYSNSRCTLYRRGDEQQQELRKKLIFNEKIHEVTHNHPAVHYHLLDARIDRCIYSPSPFGNENRSTVAGSLEISKCLRDTTTDLYLMSPSSWDDWLQLPLLGIVMAVTKDWLNGNKHEMDRITDHWDCYAKTHNYIFV
jgi:hypothetical protein